MKARARAEVGGWTLVELLIAMTLSLLVIAGIGEIYLASKRSYEIQNSLARLQDVGRYTTELLTQDIRNAGYWGLVDTSSVAITPSVTATNGCSTDTTWGMMVTQNIFGFDSTQDASTYACIDDRRGGDILTVRYGNPSSGTPYTGTAYYIRTTRTSGDILLGPAGPVGASPTTDHELTAHVYYVTDSSTATECENSGGDALPALARETLVSSGASVGHPTKEELITGIEELQFQFGVDTNGDGTLDEYRNASELTLADWSKVRTVRFWVLVRDDCEDQSYTDGASYAMGNLPTYSPGDHYRRALYTTTVALRN